MTIALSRQAAQGAQNLLADAVNQLREGRIQGWGTGEVSDILGRLPLTSALLGRRITDYNDLTLLFDQLSLKEMPSGSDMESILQAGEAALIAAETGEALRCMSSGGQGNADLLPDEILRKIGVSIVDGTVAGVAILCGTAGDNIAAVRLVKALRNKGILVMLAGEIIEQCAFEENLLSLDRLIIPLGKDSSQAIHAFTAAARIGFLLGSLVPDDRAALLKFMATRLPAFIITLGSSNPEMAAICAGGLVMGFPVITDQPLPPEEELVGLFETARSGNVDELINLAVELTGIKVQHGPLQLPIKVNPAYEGEIVRKADTWVEFGSSKVTAFELLRMVGKEEVEDGKVTVIGPEIDEIPEGSQWPLGIVIKVYGRKMQEDFVGIMERRIHYFISYGEGLWHTSGRDLVSMRISKEAKQLGFKIRDMGELLIHMFRATFGTIINRLEVTIFTDPGAVANEVKVAREAYALRDVHLKGLTDEMVDTFYSCTLCQSHSPNHVCILTPERGGLCGAVTWLDAKASYEMSPVGPNQPICKGECLDAVKGMWKSVNEYMCKASNQTVEEVNLYTLMDRPVTSCGCFEAVMAVLPQANGVMITARDYSGDTPSGMTFTKLMGACGGGVQIPGFLGVSRRFITSAKFIPADGGLARVVWMSKELKESLRSELTERAKALGLGDDFVDKIADETTGVTEDEILPFLQARKHPALNLPPVM
ncbi:acetyl-CoA decarbonylase/synthase complex subunit alpha/beta [Sporomusa sp.]|uniref:acetyl-CoA decarbonylase/synthase complex subunit alpha/beta n=1 Tax=Sporomusa sp. TaxID=2078658 RepID=UPI002B7A1B92|nr:acetyl-CoA decarbonylase/synthase complex subunit alpha/beta [Sporomusa sp.]HWR44941.1 acetyl-CoA decarbonylase/synthase complex subunit alpha/beta [Sporomusa sp.]